EGAPAPVRPAAQPTAEAEAAARLAAFREVWRLAAERFYDRNMRGVDWEATRVRFAPRAAAARDDREFAAVVNEMLGTLGSSHTRYYTDRDSSYYFLRDAFRGMLGQSGIEWDDPGLVTVERPEGTFVRDVLDGGAAAAAGVRVGDRIVTDGPFDLVGTFEGKAGTPVPLLLQSTPQGPVRRVEIVPRRIGGQRAYLEATQASVRRLPLPGGGEAGYVRLWALSNWRFLGALEQALTTLAGTGGLVLDLRGGYGGEVADYFDPFFRGDTGRLEVVDRDGRRRPFVVSWDGPVVVLIDEETRSAKELLAYGLKRAERARLVGTRTAGAVLGARLFRITDRSLLLLPVTDFLVDGRRLEGVGVEPDVVVAAPLPYRNGADPQLERALAELAAMQGAGTVGGG
ncbi:MAG TPA: S41 family peptidase, partial [Thermodesulfobacteriota bacterium]|nr:S41 family peptidase [Thermodesulfobacteriota bacterium]